jgi:hypothetical protein
MQMVFKRTGTPRGKRLSVITFHLLVELTTLFFCPFRLLHIGLFLMADIKLT